MVTGSDSTIAPFRNIELLMLELTLPRSSFLLYFGLVSVFVKVSNSNSRAILRSVCIHVYDICYNDLQRCSPLDPHEFLVPFRRFGGRFVLDPCHHMYVVKMSPGLAELKSRR